MNKRPTKVTIKEMAHRLGLSPAAVSSALSDKVSQTIRLSPETEKRVRNLAQELGFRPNRAARVLRSGRSELMGIIAGIGLEQLHAIHHYYARQNAHKIGLLPILHEIDGEDAKRIAVDMMLDAKVEAALVIGDMDDEYLRACDAGIPLFVIGSPVVHPKIRSYCVDKRGGFAMLAAHLIESGYTKIKILIEQGRSRTSRSLSEGCGEAVYQAVENGANVSLSFQSIKVTQSGFQTEAASHMYALYSTGYLGMKEIINTGDRPDAVICQTDAWAQGAIRACKDAGIDVPGDIAVAGFNNEPSSSTGGLSLTSVDQPIEELHQRAFADVRTALEQGFTAASPLMLPCKLFPRESTRRPA